MWKNGQKLFIKLSNFYSKKLGLNLQNLEGTPTVPRRRGWYRRIQNCTTGKNSQKLSLKLVKFF